MGDRTISYKKCPQCGKTYEVYDAPSSNMYCARCDHCGYDEGMDYYEIPAMDGSGWITVLMPTIVKNYICKLEDEVKKQ